jgi:hypothetical protein
MYINAPSFPVQASKFWGGSDGSSEESTDYSSVDVVVVVVVQLQF